MLAVIYRVVGFLTGPRENAVHIGIGAGRNPCPASRYDAVAKGGSVISSLRIRLIAASAKGGTLTSVRILSCIVLEMFKLAIVVK